MIITVSDKTRFKFTARGANRADLQFDATTLGVGQSVSVGGQFQAGTPPTFAARAVFLRLQSIVGNFASILATSGDGKTGGFSMLPCGPILGGRSITVLTFNQTAFAGVSDLNGLTARPTLVVKGLLFYQQTPGSMNNVTWSPPANVQVAKQVHQLPEVSGP